LADSGYESARYGVHAPIKQPADGKTLAVDSPSRIGDFVKAALVLTHFEHRYQPIPC
jgi:hypothetical protein